MTPEYISKSDMYKKSDITLFLEEILARVIAASPYSNISDPEGRNPVIQFPLGETAAWNKPSKLAFKAMTFTSERELLIMNDWMCSLECAESDRVHSVSLYVGEEDEGKDGDKERKKMRW